MKQVWIGIAALTGAILLAVVALPGLDVLSPNTSFVAGRAASATSPTPPTDQVPAGNPRASHAEVASPVAFSKVRTPIVPSYAVPGCPPLVVTSFTATAAPRAVVLAWSVSGGCDSGGWIAWHFDPPTTYPGYWQIDIHGAMRTYTSHPQRPANAQGQCLFSLFYELSLDGSAPDGRGVPVVFAYVSNLNLC